MKRQLLLALGVLLLLAGWLSAFLLNSSSQESTIYILGPTLLLGVGMGVVLKAVGGKLTALTLALTALTALLTMNQIYPSRGVSISAFQKRMQAQGSVGTFLPVNIQASDRAGIFNNDPVLEAFAEIEVQLFAKLPGAPRMMTFGPQGRLYVSIPDLGAIYQLYDQDGDGFAEQPHLYHVGLDRPHGLVWDTDQLYVAEPSQLLALSDNNQDNQVDEVRTITSGLPDDGGHWTRTLAKGPADKLYLSIGSRCNACEETDQRRAAVLKIDPESGNYEIFARGLRNSVGLAFSPDKNVLWGSDNGRDMLGDELPPDEINQITTGGDYGWPYCYGQQALDPQLGSKSRCQSTLSSQVDLPAHSAPLGIAFGHALNAPLEYRESLYVALHGSWNRSQPRGYKLIRIPYKNGQMETYGKDFLRGWLVSDKAWGRPVAPVVGPDGNLYLSDDRAHAIYRISWKGMETN
ncbi:MAG: PQQ-dependent sugar dehydrogenase [Deltaproteobacteria bacterium]|jgi:glucose/arabinose dehydrogenase|nr:PQQ-dependent sugar dehydrogenase [Deltaproteobacteria bacterium]MCW8891895.1 PQQ-dependent sugar dehydrogenase [Deltaproteobacteria bacterium]MCW9049792.1 PQQ-dependent sugar dehydrogenase [Deltaproteobacteria bacterium]